MFICLRLCGLFGPLLISSRGFAYRAYWQIDNRNVPKQSSADGTDFLTSLLARICVNIRLKDRMSSCWSLLFSRHFPQIAGTPLIIYLGMHSESSPAARPPS